MCLMLMKLFRMLYSLLTCHRMLDNLHPRSRKKSGINVPLQYSIEISSSEATFKNSLIIHTKIKQSRQRNRSRAYTFKTGNTLSVTIIIILDIKMIMLISMLYIKILIRIFLKVEQYMYLCASSNYYDCPHIEHRF